MTALCDIASPKAAAGTIRLDASHTPWLRRVENFKNLGSHAHISWMYVPLRDAGSANESSMVYEGYKFIKYVAVRIVADE
jgi:hypothetical protein